MVPNELESLKNSTPVCMDNVKMAESESPVVDQVFVIEAGDSSQPTEGNQQLVDDEDHEEKLKAIYERFLMQELKGQLSLVHKF